MPAYLIVYETITNTEQFGKYLQALQPELYRRGVHIVAAGPPNVVERILPWKHTVVLEWPSGKDVIDFWNSEEYANIKKLREGAADVQATILEGIDMQ